MAKQMAEKTRSSYGEERPVIYALENLSTFDGRIQWDGRNTKDGQHVLYE